MDYDGNEVPYSNNNESGLERIFHIAIGVILAGLFVKAFKYRIISGIGTIASFAGAMLVMTQTDMTSNTAFIAFGLFIASVVFFARVLSYWR